MVIVQVSIMCCVEGEGSGSDASDSIVAVIAAAE